MTTNVSHVNPMLAQLKEQHKNQIQVLQDKIKNLEYEIELLENFLNRSDDC